VLGVGARMQGPAAVALGRLQDYFFNLLLPSVLPFKAQFR
jgi:hypothetical protein